MVWQRPPKPPNPFDNDPFKRCPGGSAFTELFTYMGVILLLQMKLQKKHLLIAFALASEWALAFAFAWAFAKSIAHANDMDIDARLARLEDEHARLWPRPAGHGQPGPTVVEDDRE